METDRTYPKLLSLAVHEMRTPAGVVGGYLRMLRGDGDASLGERQRKMIVEAEKSCARLVALIAELSEIGKIDDGLIAMARQTVDFFSLAEDAANEVDEGAERDVRLQVRGAASGATMSGDASRLKQAVQAVFRAVLRETAGPGVIVADRRIVGAGRERSSVLVVAEASRVAGAYDEPRIEFDEQRGGLGLLLPLARRVVEAHGGRIWSPGASGDAGSQAARGAAVISLPLSE